MSRLSPMLFPVRILTPSHSKYLDSHLKPYYCGREPGCKDQSFSSNACLFRHEREAHGLHGHGVNPYLCPVPTCERAKEDGGFPRSWNLKDHVKRVHGELYPRWYRETSDSSSSSNSSTQGRSGRKRRGSSPAESAPMKRQSSSQAKAQRTATAAYSGYVYQPENVYSSTTANHGMSAYHVQGLQRPMHDEHFLSQYDTYATQATLPYRANNSHLCAYTPY